MRYNARNSITGRESTGKGNATMKSKTEFPDYKKLSVADLVPYARNSRTHSPQQVDKIAASIREFGFLNPIIVDGRNGIVAGHGRVLAAQKLGLPGLTQAISARRRSGPMSSQTTAWRLMRDGTTKC